MKIRHLSLAALVCFAAVPVVASAQVKKAGDGYLLRMKFTKGLALRYGMTSTVKGIPPSAMAPDGTITLTGPFSTTVQSIKGPNATVAVSIGPMLMNNQQATGKAQTRTATIDSRGKAVDKSDTGIGLLLPEKPVKIGQSWSGPLPISSGTMTAGGMSITYRFEGLKKIGGKQLAVVSLTTSPDQQIKSGSGTLYINPQDGFTQKMTMNLVIGNPAGGKPLTTTINVARK
ncbi:MAG: hypothetical protein QOJ65_2192 [Fimbriimonadaceae bacterium]|jgi:hypothetical protein|nr:hypothetical protein [Fimbriimonadaceae bacterium]